MLSGLIVFGGEIFKRWGFSLLELSVLLYLPVLVFLFPFIRGKKAEIVNHRNLRGLLLWSFFAGMTVILQFGAIVAGAPVALVVLLLYTQPIWTMIVSRLFFKSSIMRTDIISLLLVVMGIVVLVSPWSVDKVGSINGIVMALFGGLALSGWVCVGSRIGQSKIDPYVGKFMETLLEIIIIVLVLFSVQFIIKQPEIVKFSLGWSASIWVTVVVYSLLTQVMGHVLYLKGTKVVPAKEAGIIMLLEPVSGAILAVLFLRQAITLEILLGGAMIILANYLVLSKRRMVSG